MDISQGVPLSFQPRLVLRDFFESSNLESNEEVVNKEEIKSAINDGRLHEISVLFDTKTCTLCNESVVDCHRKTAKILPARRRHYGGGNVSAAEEWFRESDRSNRSLINRRGDMFAHLHNETTAATARGSLMTSFVGNDFSFTRCPRKIDNIDEVVVDDECMKLAERNCAMDYGYMINQSKFADTWVQCHGEYYKLSKFVLEARNYPLLQAIQEVEARGEHFAFPPQYTKKEVTQFLSVVYGGTWMQRLPLEKNLLYGVYPMRSADYLHKPPGNVEAALPFLPITGQPPPPPSSIPISTSTPMKQRPTIFKLPASTAPTSGETVIVVDDMDEEELRPPSYISSLTGSKLEAMIAEDDADAFPTPPAHKRARVAPDDGPVAGDAPGLSALPKRKVGTPKEAGATKPSSFSPHVESPWRCPRSPSPFSDEDLPRFFPGPSTSVQEDAPGASSFPSHRKVAEDTKVTKSSPPGEEDMEAVPESPWRSSRPPSFDGDVTQSNFPGLSSSFAQEDSDASANIMSMATDVTLSLPKRKIAAPKGTRATKPNLSTSEYEEIDVPRPAAPLQKNSEVPGPSSLQNKKVGVPKGTRKTTASSLSSVHDVSGPSSFRNKKVGAPKGTRKTRASPLSSAHDVSGPSSLQNKKVGAPKGSRKTRASPLSRMYKDASAPGPSSLQNKKVGVLKGTKATRPSPLSSAHDDAPGPSARAPITGSISSLFPMSLPADIAKDPDFFAMAAASVMKRGDEIGLKKSLGLKKTREILTRGQHFVRFKMVHYHPDYMGGESAASESSDGEDNDDVINGHIARAEDEPEDVGVEKSGLSRIKTKEELSAILHKCITEDAQLLADIHMYEAIPLSRMRTLLQWHNYKTTDKLLQEYLDEQTITFSTADEVKQTGKQREPGRKRKRKPAAATKK